MKLKTKIILSLGLVFILFSMVIGVALIGMQSVKGRFESFLQKDLALLQAVTGMYADGLQGGQALRNIVLDPANKTAYKNLEKAGDGFKEESRKALSLATSDAADRKVLEDVIALREQYIPVQVKIIGLASGDQAAAIASVNQQETPLWRSIRERLLNFINIKNVAVENTKTQLEVFSQQILMTALALMLVVLMLGAGIIFWLIRHIMRQLGGEPVYAIEVARAISTGDLSRIIRVESGDDTSLLSAMNAMRENLTVTIGGVRQATDT
ncbi:MAG: MCP four helix bundle domain-containing protein, partial [Rhodoferax sp.]|nr:MCP four helix bundle domain-containing protein [Rhodoferax sp.]